MIRRPAAILALLTGLNLLNYLDRYVLVGGAAADPWPSSSSRTSRAGSSRPCSSLGYFVTSPIFGALGDRLPRKGLIALGVLVWSAATIASGLREHRGMLLVARAFVGIGEASYATLAPTIIDDITPPETQGPRARDLLRRDAGRLRARLPARRPRREAAGAGARRSSSRAARASCSRCSCLVDRGAGAQALDREAGHPRATSARSSKVPLYRRGVLGYCAYTAAIGAFSYWAPKFLYRAVRARSLKDANLSFGVDHRRRRRASARLGGMWADRVRAASPHGDQPTRTSNAHASRFPPDLRARQRDRCAARGDRFVSPSPTASSCSSSSAISRSSCLHVADQRDRASSRVPPELRASAMAVSIFAIHLLGDLWSKPFVGMLIDHWAVEVAMMTLPVAIAVSAFIWWPRKAKA